VVWQLSVMAVGYWFMLHKHRNTFVSGASHDGGVVDMNAVFLVTEMAIVGDTWHPVHVVRCGSLNSTHSLSFERIAIRLTVAQSMKFISRGPAAAGFRRSTSSTFCLVTVVVHTLRNDRVFFRSPHFASGTVYCNSSVLFYVTLHFTAV